MFETYFLWNGWICLGQEKVLGKKDRIFKEKNCELCISYTIIAGYGSVGYPERDATLRGARPRRRYGQMGRDAERSQVHRWRNI